jgi:bifunctional non-homologous end joining protein LigD
VAAKQKAILKVAGREVQVSSLDKVLFPNSGFNKAQLIDYYVRISKYLLPHLKDRPLTMKLFPDGVTGPSHYRHNAPPYTPSWIKRVSMWRTDRTEQIHAIAANDLPTLVWLANAADIEMHPLLSRSPNFERPTMMVLDLDPGPPATILDCAGIALQVKELLEQLKLKSFIKSSGSKGLHLYVPLNTPVTYEKTQAFAHQLALTLERMNPDKVVSEMAKAARTGKVFVDYSQNARHKSTASVYSLRAKENGPFVSMPIDWKALEKAYEAKDVNRFFIRPDAAIEQVENTRDLFAPLLKLEQKLPANIENAFKGLKMKPRVQTTRNNGSQTSTTRNNGASETPAKLRKYNAKRDFSITAEPSGASNKTARTKKEKALLFVIQKHAASHLHYDFRLEMEGVLRSWAVPKGPPYEKGERRLAMHVEDHPMDYARFEGIIPKGQYGGGTVMVWDIGTYTVRDGNPVAAYHKGSLHLEMKGKKLKGEWILVRGRSEEGEKQPWYLIKAGESMDRLSPRRDDQSVLTRRSMARIAADKSAEWSSNR